MLKRFSKRSRGFFRDYSHETIKAEPRLKDSLDDAILAPASKKTYYSLPLANTKSTRVLRILPLWLQDEDDITCQLEVISLDDDPIPDYYAVSYVWGSPFDTSCIMVNNEPFVVRKNLWAFLDYIRKQGFQGLLWIDAISINQACIPERNHQVALMGDIYRMATKVLAWLGPESTFVSPTWETFNRPSGNTSKVESFLRAPILDSIRLMFEDIWTSSGYAGHTIGAELLQVLILLFKYLGDLFSAEYWSRMWIVQEFILARDISLLTDRSQMTGEELMVVWETISQDPTVVAFKYRMDGINTHLLESNGQSSQESLPPQRAEFDNLEELDEEVSSAFKRMEFSTAVQTIERRKELHSTFRIKPLEDWVSRFQELKCFDPRDHVYALLSLTSPEDMAFYELSPDYGRSELLLYTQLAYGLWMRGDFTRSFLFGSVLGIEAQTVVRVNEKVRERALLDRSLGRRSSPREVAKEIARELYWRVTNASQPLFIAPPQAPVLFRRQYPLEGRRRRSAGQ